MPGAGLCGFGIPGLAGVVGVTVAELFCPAGFAPVGFGLVGPGAGGAVGVTTAAPFVPEEFAPEGGAVGVTTGLFGSAGVVGVTTGRLFGFAGVVGVTTGGLFGFAGVVGVALGGGVGGTTDGLLTPGLIGTGSLGATRGLV